MSQLVLELERPVAAIPATVLGELVPSRVDERRARLLAATVAVDDVARVEHAAAVERLIAGGRYPSRPHR